MSKGNAIRKDGMIAFCNNNGEAPRKKPTVKQMIAHCQKADKDMHNLAKYAASLEEHLRNIHCNTRDVLDSNPVRPLGADVLVEMLEEVRDRTKPWEAVAG